MKRALALVTLVLVGCGKFEHPVSQSQIGELRPLSLTRALAPEEVTRLTSICQALARKNSNLNLQLPTTPITFNVVERNCEDVKLFDGAQSVRVKLENFSSFVFESTNASRPFPFNKVETPVDGVMAGVCQNLQNLQMPMVKTSGEATYITATDSDTCVSSVSELCVTIETATPVETNFAIHTVETIKFRSNPNDINNPSYGYFTDRFRRTSIGCSPVGKAKTIRATMTSM